MCRTTSSERIRYKLCIIDKKYGIYIKLRRLANNCVLTRVLSFFDWSPEKNENNIFWSNQSRFVRFVRLLCSLFKQIVDRSQLKRALLRSAAKVAKVTALHIKCQSSGKAILFEILGSNPKLIDSCLPANTQWALSENCELFDQFFISVNIFE